MDVIVFSHLRWNFVFQRPQHLMTRCGRANRVFFWEEPIFDTESSFLEVRKAEFNVSVVVPHLPEGLSGDQVCHLQEWFLTGLMQRQCIKDYVLWYYTPMALKFTRHLRPQALVYDCMDELSAFRGAPLGLRAAEKALFAKADVVFTGGRSLYQSKKRQHRSVHCFPSSIDVEFFGRARHAQVPPFDQVGIPEPRLGYCGVIDERMDGNLIASVADRRPRWQIVMIGPIVKVNPSELPRRENIHYLGAKEYQHLPSYLAGWDVGLMPFALNESTRFISPTKTPEYLAAGLPVVSTPITDVVNPYGVEGFVEIANTPDEFVTSIERAIATKNCAARMAKVDEFLSQQSWDLTWQRMHQLIEQICLKQAAVDETFADISDTAAAD
jgi:UDP-galactopyranose mutase